MHWEVTNFIVLSPLFFLEKKITEFGKLMDKSACRTSVFQEKWEKLEGTFSLSTMPDRVVFYLEGPSPGIDLLIQSVEITCAGPNEVEVIVLLFANPILL